VAVAGPGLNRCLLERLGRRGAVPKRGVKLLRMSISAGGTTNIAVFENGNVIDTTCLNNRRKLVEVDLPTGRSGILRRPGGSLRNILGSMCRLEKGRS
jgi:ethanolamine utilization protein EutA